MKPKTIGGDPELASGWPSSQVEESLDAAQKALLVQFLKRRYEERFLKPIRTLVSAPGNSQGYGFAVMALCSLLVETLQCYRKGFPTTNAGEFKRLKQSVEPPPPEYEIVGVETGAQVFKDFFALSAHQALFNGVDGAVYYGTIRNGLLHQAQTKSGWKIRKGRAQLWDVQDKIVDRDKFACAVESAFNLYLDELSSANWDDEVWTKARRKIWWLIKSS